MSASYNDDSRSSVEQLPAKATQCKTAVTESEFTKSKCTESMAAESKVVCIVLVSHDCKNQEKNCSYY